MIKTISKYRVRCYREGLFILPALDYGSEMWVYVFICFSIVSSHCRIFFLIEIWTVKKTEHRRIDAFLTVVLEKTLESPLDCKEIQPVYPKGNQSSIFIERTDAEAETPILWPRDVKNGLIWKDPDVAKD